MDWIGLAQDRDRWRTLGTAVMSLRVSWNAGNFLTSCKPVGFTRTLPHGVSKQAASETTLVHMDAVSLTRNKKNFVHCAMTKIPRNSEREIGERNCTCDQGGHTHARTHHTHTRACARTHTLTRAHTRAHTHTHRTMHNTHTHRTTHNTHTHTTIILFKWRQGVTRRVLRNI